MMTRTGQRYAAVVGTFDGVHRGHRFLIDQLGALARERGLGTRVYTFDDSPLAVLRPEAAPRLLTLPDEKLRLLADAGVGECVMGRFGDVAGMTAREYIAMLAAEGVEVLLIGYDNRFGRDGLKTVAEFGEAARGTGVEVLQARELCEADGSAINSSAIRRRLADSDVEGANAMLGYGYRLEGVVGHGKELGRRLGFPTANVVPAGDGRKLVPGVGVYACRAVVPGGGVYGAMVNIGHRPTVDGTDAPLSVEAHLVGFTGDLYGATVELEFVRFLRAERRFASVEELRRQLEKDRGNLEFGI